MPVGVIVQGFDVPVHGLTGEEKKNDERCVEKIFYSHVVPLNDKP
jgi:hypothetical protein